MKLLLLFALIGLAYGQFYRNPYAYNPRYKPNYYSSTGQEKLARTLRENYDLGSEGNYQYGYETENGIQAQQTGYLRNLGRSPPNLAQTVQGSHSWTSPEGKVISISYIADENGYRAVGDAIPTPHPIPDYILRSIEYNKAAERSRGKFV